MNYNVFYSEEDSAFIAESEEFPGISAFGNTKEKAIEELSSLIAYLLKIQRDEDIDDMD